MKYTKFDFNPQLINNDCWKTGMRQSVADHTLTCSMTCLENGQAKEMVSDVLNKTSHYGKYVVVRCLVGV